jgi:hypothetical protein
MSGRNSCGRDVGWVRSFPALACVSFFLTAMGSQSTALYKWEVDSSVSYSSGDYGEEENTDIAYIPVSIKRFFSDGQVGVVVPWLYVKSPSFEPEGGTETDSGLGDIWVKGRYYAVEQHGSWPYVDLLAKVKLPTADEGKYLGTGELDYEFGVDVSRWFARDWFGFAELDYTFVGDPPDFNYDDQIFLDLGGGRQVTPSLQLSGYYEFASAIIPGDPDYQSVIFSGSYRTTPQVRVYGLVEAGLTDGAPDYGVTFGCAYRY